MEDKNTTLYVGIVAVILFVVFLIQQNKAKVLKAQSAGELDNFIATGTGGNTNDSVTNTTAGVKPDPYYAGADADAKAIKAAGCYAIYICIGSSNDQTVIRVLQGKTKAQLAAIERSFQSLYGRNLDDWIKSNFWNEGQRNIYQIINQIRING